MDSSTTGYRSIAPVPPHVPPELVVDFDFYNMEGVEENFHQAWKRLQNAHRDKVLIWTPRNEGHWIPLHGEDVHHIFGDYRNFTSKCLIIPKSAGEKFTVLPTMLDPPEHLPLRTKKKCLAAWKIENQHLAFHARSRSLMNLRGSWSTYHLGRKLVNGIPSGTSL